VSDALAVAVPAPLAAPLELDAEGSRRLLEAFLQGRNENTRRAYEQTAQDFAAYVSRRFGRALRPETALGELLRAGHGPANLIALDYRADLLARVAPGTAALRLSNLRAAVKLARTLGMVPWGLETPSVRVERYRETEGPGVAAVQAIAVELRKRNGPRAARDRALLALLYGQGLRRGEAVSLDVEHLDVAGARVHVLGKGRLEREWVALSAPVLEALRTWLAVRPGAPAGPLFFGWRGGRVAGRLTGRAVAKLSQGWGAAVVGKGVRPHGLRHTAATALLDAGMSWAEVAGFTRHRDPSTLRFYDDNRARRGSKAAARLADLVTL
jgi:integrase/recombinase XerC